jgi:hypothetical protein
MSELLIGYITSLDGYGAAVGRPGRWSLLQLLEYVPMVLAGPPGTG